MTLQASGQISLSQVNTELGNTSTAQIALGQSTVRVLAGVASGQISLSNLYGKSNATAGQVLYSVPGTYTWTVPTGVTSVSVICVGGGQSGGAGWTGGTGGSLAYKNNISVTPGTGMTVIVGAGGAAASPTTIYTPNNGSASVFSTHVFARGGGMSGAYTGDAGYYGGTGGGRGGGGAAGYSANGANGADNQQDGPGLMSGGGGGGGASGPYASVFDANGVGYTYYGPGGAGGGVGLKGSGTSGSGSINAATGTNAGSRHGGGGSGGGNGQWMLSTGDWSDLSRGGAYGGGGGAGGEEDDSDGSSWTYAYTAGGAGGTGGVRIIWGGGRSFPSNAADASLGSSAGNYAFTVLSGTAAPYSATYVTPLPTTNISSGIVVVGSVDGEAPLKLGSVPGQSYTITAWVYPTSNSGNNVIIDAPAISHQSPFYSYHLRLTYGNVFFGYNTIGYYARVDVAGATATVGQWNHVAVTVNYNASAAYSTITTYLNGYAVNSGTSSARVYYYGKPLTIGNAPNWGGLFTGKIGKVTIYKDKGFTASEILAEYQAGFSG